MPDQLQSIVQRMIDAGEPEENIATVIQHFKAQAPPREPSLAERVINLPTGAGQPIADYSRPNTPDPDSYWPGVLKGVKDYANELGAGMFEGTAHPQTAGDFLSLVLPGAAGATGVGPKVTRVGVGDKIAGTGRILTAAGTKASGANAVGLGVIGDVASRAMLGNDAGAVAAAAPYMARATGNVLERLGNRIVRGGPEPAPLYKVAPTLPETPAPIRGRMVMPVRSEPVQTPLAVQMNRPGYFPETPAPETMRFPEPPMRVSEQTAPMVAPTVPTTADELAATIAKLQERANAISRVTPPSQSTQGALRTIPQTAETPSPLRGPRIQSGAERVGRAQGLSKEQVRQQTGPVLDENPGEASPILPQGPHGDIVDALKRLPPGPAREAYVQAATSGKTKWQVENIRRTLEHLGLLVPAAAGAGLLRQSILDRLQGGQP